ncbi:ATP11-domain-containing protein [Ceratobasidium sp. AG-I]|nr:ATP11-domain-containing protein [Ceratobasidium sp. AG-I]
MNHLRLRLAHPRYLPALSTHRNFTSCLVRQNLSQKYADKLKKRAEEAGAKDVDELRERLKKEAQAEKAKKQAEQAKLEATRPLDQGLQSAVREKGSSLPAPKLKERKDSSPIKPLDTILNLPKLLSTSPPLTQAQLGVLWTAYHARKEGVLCATVPLNMYEQLVARARRWGQFVVPLPRGVKPAEEEGEAEGGTEMFFVEWGVHHSPPVPNPNVDPLGLPISSSVAPSAEGSNPPILTLLFTPLQEYKHRQSFAAPHLALTFHTDLAATHGAVLLRGEITPAQQGDGRWMLSQEEAQALVVAMQKFYLPGTGEGALEREALLRCFHEKPEEFKWEQLLKLSDIGIAL